MARLFGLLGNRSDLAGHVFALEADALRVRRDAPSSRPSPQSVAGPLGWGIGFWQGGKSSCAVGRWTSVTSSTWRPSAPT